MSMLPIHLMRRGKGWGAVPHRKVYLNVAGTNTVDGQGNKIIVRGANHGHNESGNSSDAAAFLTAGLNTQRYPERGWGTWGGAILDIEDNSRPSFTTIAGDDRLRDILVWGRAAGQLNVVPYDTNCGQTERAGDTTCMLGEANPHTIFTPGQGQIKRAQHIARGVWQARRYYGLIDAMEPIVEPFPVTTLPTGNQILDVQRFQEEFMEAVWRVDPDMVFIIGFHPAYGTQNLSAGIPARWKKYKIILTANLLDSASSNTATLPAKIAACTAARTANGCPFLVQQVGTTQLSEQTANPGQYLLMRNVLNLLNLAGIGWIWWEWVGPWQGGTKGSIPDAAYGILNGDARDTSRLINSGRMTELVNAANAARVYQ